MAWGDVGSYALTSLSVVKTHLGISAGTWDALLGDIINKATDLIEKWCDRKLMSRTYTHERYDGDGSGILFLNEYPITAVAALYQGVTNVLSCSFSSTNESLAWAKNDLTDITLTVEGGTLDGSATVAIGSYATLALLAAAISAESGWTGSVVGEYDDYPSAKLLSEDNLHCLETTCYLRAPTLPLSAYEIYENEGYVYGSGASFPIGSRNIIVTYTAGYSSTPEALEMACIELVTNKYKNRKKPSGVKTEVLADAEFTYFDMEKLEADLLARVGSFRRLEPVGIA